MIHRLLPAFVVLAAPLSAAAQEKQDAPAPVEKRTLQMSRPEKKGAKYEISTTASSTSTADLHVDDGVEPAGSGSVEAKLDGLLEVTDVSPKAGNINAYKFTVTKMTLTDGSGADDGLEPGTVITATLKGKATVFSAHGGEVQGTLHEGLALVMPEISSRDEPDGDILNPPGPVAPGDKWDMDKKKVEETWKDRDVEVDPAKSKAELIYKGPATAAGISGDTVTATINAVLTKVAGLPADAKLLSADLNSEATVVISRDSSIPMALSTRQVIETRTRYAGKHEGKEYEMELKGSLLMRQTVKPAK